MILRVDFWLYVIMALIFVSGIIFCLVPVVMIQEKLKKASKSLKMRKADGSYIYNNGNFLRCEELDDHWNRFISNLELMRKNNGSCEIEDFINEKTAIHEPGHSAFGEMIPGMLTTLGIIGSFYGIVTGLSTLDLSTTETMSISIVVLISGMKMAFNTSIVGAVLALIFQLARRVVVSNAQTTLKRFTTLCQNDILEMLTPDTTLMQTLHAILAELRRINTGR